MALVTLKELLGNIKDKGAVGAFSTYDLFTAQGIIAGAEKVNMPVILMIGSDPLYFEFQRKYVSRFFRDISDTFRINPN